MDKCPPGCKIDHAHELRKFSLVSKPEIEPEQQPVKVLIICENMQEVRGVRKTLIIAETMSGDINTPDGQPIPDVSPYSDVLIVYNDRVLGNLPVRFSFVTKYDPMLRSVHDPKTAMRGKRFDAVRRGWWLQQRLALGESPVPVDEGQGP